MDTRNGDHPPPPETSSWVSYALSFGVSVAVGLAPLLGTVKVPLFEPLLGILPPSERATAIPFTATLMGMVAVSVQWFVQNRMQASRLSRGFRRTLAAAVLAVLMFFIVNVLVVARVPVAGGDTAILLHGFGSAHCPECAGTSDIECLKLISFDLGSIERCWGSSGVRGARIALVLSYIATMVLFGALVGFLVLGKKLISKSTVSHTKVSS